MNRGRLIAFEGLDGCGKTTQIARLADSLRKAGHDPVVTAEPTDGEFGRRIRAMARGSAPAVAPEEELRWFVEAHAFRIDPRAGVGRPTPEGAHRDGVDFVAVVLVERRGVRGGETRVFDAAGPDSSKY